MDKHSLLIEVFSTTGEIAKKSDFVAVGFSGQDVYSLCKKGLIERVQHGYYKLSGAEEPGEEQVLSAMLKQGIVCVESALFYYGYSDFAPREWTIAVPRSFSRVVKNISERVPTKAYYVQNDVYHLGETTGDFNGVTLPVYDRERTICDCFKYRTKLDNEIFNKAVNSYADDEKKDLAALSKYAKEMKVYGKMMNVMEVLLNG